jgi:signal transduction histidine kinase
MGERARLRTRPAHEPGYEYRLDLDWAAFDQASVVEDVPLRIRRARSSTPAGTDILVDGVRTKIGRREVQRLARALILLSDPFTQERGFYARLLAPEFSDLEDLVRSAYFGDAEFRLFARIGPDGRASATVYDWKGDVLWDASQEDLSDSAYDAPEATFELWVFLLDHQSMGRRTASVSQLREWLKVVGGAHVYHRGLRVHPYGDPGHDWLDMNLARVRNPELRPSTNTSIGRVVVADADERLIEKTDRTGFIENEAFGELRRFATDALEWMAGKRLAAREAARRSERKQSASSFRRARRSVETAMTNADPQTREQLGAAIRRLERAQDRERRALREDLQLYRTLASVGTTVAVFAHEAAKPVALIEQMADAIARRAEKFTSEAAHSLDTPISVISASARSLRSFASMPLRLLERDKRRIGRVDLNSVVLETTALFEPFLEAAQVITELDLVAGQATLRASVTMGEAVLTNLITNAINAFTASNTDTGERKILIRTAITDESVLLRVMDSGPGISMRMDEIWLPGRTSTPGGTGLGLTIVHDTVSDLGGTISATSPGELGGAEFVIELPSPRD